MGMMTLLHVTVLLLVSTAPSGSLVWEKSWPNIGSYGYSQTLTDYGDNKFLLISALEQDIAANDSLIVTTSYALYRFKVDTNQVDLIAGGEYGYQEGVREMAKFLFNVGSFQISRDSFIVADSGNDILRMIQNGQTSIYAGNINKTIRDYLDDPVNVSLAEAHFSVITALARYSPESFVLLDGQGPQLVNILTQSVVKIFDSEEIPFATAMFVDIPNVRNSDLLFEVYLATNCSVTKLTKNDIGGTLIKTLIKYDSPQHCPITPILRSIYSRSLLRLGDGTILMSSMSGKGIYHLTLRNDSITSTKFIDVPEYVETMTLTKSKDRLLIGVIGDLVLYEEGFSAGMNISSSIVVIASILILSNSILQ